MILMKDFKEYPDGSDILLSLLKRFPTLKKEQIIIFFIQSDKTYNRERVNSLIQDLIEMNELFLKDDIISLSEREEDESLIDAFWVLLHYLDGKTKFDQAQYPAEIVFKNENEINEVIIMDDDSQLKMDYLSKRKTRKNKCRYNFLFTSGTIDDFDDELFTDVNVTLITMTQGKDSPKLIYHEVENE